MDGCSINPNRSLGPALVSKLRGDLAPFFWGLGGLLVKDFVALDAYLIRWLGLHLKVLLGANWCMLCMESQFLCAVRLYLALYWVHMCSYIVVVRSYYILLRCINICVCLGLLFSQDKIMMFAAVFCTDIYKLITTYRLWSKMGNTGFLAHNCILHWVLYLSFFGFPLFASIVHDSSIFACSLHVCTSTCMHPCSLESVDAWCVFTACLARNMVKQTPLPHNLNKWKKIYIYI